MDLYYTLLKGTHNRHSYLTYLQSYIPNQACATIAIGTTEPKLCDTAPSDVQSFSQDLDQ